MSHYPSSQELAAFRREIAYNRDGQTHATSLAFGCVTGHAHSYERQDGIGYIAPSRKIHAHQSHVWSIARREASAMRSRAYARLACASWDPTADIDWSMPYGIVIVETPGVGISY